MHNIHIKTYNVHIRKEIILKGPGQSLNRWQDIPIVLHNHSYACIIGGNTKILNR